MEAPLLLLLLLLLPMIIPVAFTTTTTTTTAAVAEGRLGVSQMVPLLVPSPLVGAIPAAGCALTMLMLRIPTVMGMIRRTPAAAARPLPPPTAAAAAAVPVPIAPTVILPSVSVVLSVSVVPPTAAAAAATATVVVVPFPARRTRPTITMMPPIVASSSTAAGMMSSSIDVSIAAVASSVPAVLVSTGADLEPAPAAGVGLPLPPPVAGPPLHVAVDPPGVRRGLVLPLPVLPPLLGGEPVEAQEGPASASVTSGVIATAGAGVGRGHESSPTVRAGRRRGRRRRLEASPDVLGEQAGQALAAAAAAAISAVVSAMVRHDCCLLPWVPTLLLFIDRLAGTRCAAVPRYPSWLLSVYALPPAARLRLSVCRFVSLRWPVRPASGRPATDLLPAAHSTMACPWPMPPPPPP